MTETARPESTEELADAVKAAVAAGHAVVPVGGGSALDYGYPLRADAVTEIDMTGLNRVVSVEPGDLIVTVEGGATLAAVQAALLPHGLFLPLDPPYPDYATIGGILATNAYGASRIGYGTARDWLVGIAVVNAEGKSVKGGGKVVKNVTGYDIPKLHIGALGTLGIIVEATFKVAPLPEATQTVVVQKGTDETQFAQFVRAVREETSPTQAYLRTDEEGTFAVFVYRGFTEVVAEEVGRLQARLGEPGTAATMQFDELLTSAEAERAFLVRLQGLPEHDEERHAEVVRQVTATDATVQTLVGTGTTEVAFDGVDSKATLLALAQSGDHVTGYTILQAPLEFRQGDTPLWFPEPASLPLMRRLKEALDPNSIFNPGRFVGRI